MPEAVSDFLKPRIVKVDPVDGSPKPRSYLS